MIWPVALIAINPSMYELSPVLRDVKVGYPKRVTLSQAVTIEQHCHAVLKVIAEQETILPRLGDRRMGFGYPGYFVGLGYTSRKVEHATTGLPPSRSYRLEYLVSGTSRSGKRYTVAAYRTPTTTAPINRSWIHDYLRRRP